MNRAKQRLFLTLILCFAWTLTAVNPIWKYLSPAKAAVALVAGLLLIALGVYWTDRLNRSQQQISTAWFLLLFLALTTAFVVLYPPSLKHTVNTGSDREDALRIELDAVHHHQYPYDARTFLHNPPTPLPGAMLLAAPFFTVGHIAWQNFLWYALFFVFAAGFFRYRATALLYLVVLLLLSPANISDFISGGDYLTNFFYVAIAMALFSKSLSHPWYAYVPAALFLGITLSSRGIYGFILLPLLACKLQDNSRARALSSFAVVLIAAVVVTLPVFAPHPVTHLLQQLNQASAGKLRFIPKALHPQWTLPLFALVAASSAFFVRMDLARVFLIFSVASLIMLAPFALSFAVHGERQRLAYLSVSTLSFALWAMSRYESSLRRITGLVQPSETPKVCQAPKPSRIYSTHSLQAR